MPSNARKHTAGEDVVQGFAILVTDLTGGGLWQPAACEAISSPTSILGSEPHEKLDVERCPAAPDQLLEGSGSRSNEQGGVAGAGSINSRRVPTLRERVRSGCKGDRLQAAPNVGGLEGGEWPKGAGDVR